MIHFCTTLCSLLSVFFCALWYIFFSSLPEQFAAVGIFLIVDGELQDTAEVERQPAQSEHQNQAEHCLRHLPSLNTGTNKHA